MRARYAALAAAALFTACAAPAPDNGVPPGSLTGDATVEFVDLEGGCWVLDLGGEKLLPLTLPDSFRVDGIRVRVIVRPVDAATICMLGRAVEIESIERLE